MTSVTLNGSCDNQAELLLYKSNKKGFVEDIQKYSETKYTK